MDLRPVRLAGKTVDADADADLLWEKNTIISLKRWNGTADKFKRTGP